MQFSIANALLIAGAWVLWGTYPVPFKSPKAAQANIDPFVFQFMKSICVCLTSWIVLLWRPFTFSYWGFVGAALWVPAGLMFITSVKLTGVAFATPIANGCQVIVSFCWGAFYFHEEVHNWGLSVLAMLIMIAGMIGISYSVNYEKMMKAREAVGIQDAEYDGADVIKRTTIQVSENEASPFLEKRSHLPPQTSNPAAEKLKSIAGVVCACGVGFFGGTQNVPLKDAPPEAHGIQYVISFGIGSVAVIAVLTAIYVPLRMYYLKLGPPNVNLKVSLVPGTMAGILWAGGNMCNIYAVLAYGQTIGFPLVMCNMMIAGCWGVFYYNEAPRIQMKLLFIASCATLLGGVALLSVFG